MLLAALAKQLARAQKAEARVALTWSPGKSTPHHLEAAVRENTEWQPIPERQLPPREWFTLQKIVADLQLTEVDWREVLRDGYFVNGNAPWEN